jgi:hypothetical protein
MKGGPYGHRDLDDDYPLTEINRATSMKGGPYGHRDWG